MVQVRTGSDLSFKLHSVMHFEHHDLEACTTTYYMHP